MSALLGTYLASDFVWRCMGLGALARGPGDSRRVALTFDDGPGPQTPRLVEVLAEAGVRATFFLTGSEAARHPEHVALLREAGHEVQSHGDSHRPAFLMGPWAEWRHITADAHPLYRPPYGAHSPLTRLLARAAGKRVALWDVEARDWTEEGADALQARVLAQVRPGSILLLHDGPPVTPELVRRLLPALRARGLTPVTLGELGAEPLGFRAGLARAVRRWRYSG